MVVHARQFPAQDPSAHDWAIPVGVVLGLLVVTGVVGTLFYLYRKNKFTGINISSPFARRARGAGDAGLSNPIYDYGTGESEFHMSELEPPSLKDAGESLAIDASRSFDNPNYSDA
nr:hypothetical protein BaRGS_016040 [Batillaria attramentaria]